MRIAPLLNCLFAGVLCTLQAGVAPDVPTPGTNDANAYLSWLTTDRPEPSLSLTTRRAEPRDTGDMAALIELLEQNLATQRATEFGATQKANHLTLLAGMFAAAGLIALLLTAYFQWRTVNRLSGLPAVRALPALAAGGGFPMSSQAVDQSNARLLGVIERLQQRVLELEQAARAPLSEKAATSTDRSETTHSNNGAHAAANGDRQVEALLAEGQSLLHDDDPGKALACFDEVLSIEPKHAEALVKKGDALEKLLRLDEAAECYDRAIEADNAMTIAYLHKGSLFNRMERYNEALVCYEQALRTQEKGAA